MAAAIKVLATPPGSPVLGSPLSLPRTPRTPLAAIPAIKGLEIYLSGEAGASEAAEIPSLQGRPIQAVDFMGTVDEIQRLYPDSEIPELQAILTGLRGAPRDAEPAYFAKLVQDLMALKERSDFVQGYRREMRELEALIPQGALAWGEPERIEKILREIQAERADFGLVEFVKTFPDLDMKALRCRWAKIRMAKNSMEALSHDVRCRRCREGLNALRLRCRSMERQTATRMSTQITAAEGMLTDWEGLGPRVRDVQTVKLERAEETLRAQKAKSCFQVEGSI